MQARDTLVADETVAVTVRSVLQSLRRGNVALAKLLAHCDVVGVLGVARNDERLVATVLADQEHARFDDIFHLVVT